MVRQRAASEYQDLFEALGPKTQETSDEEDDDERVESESEADDGEGV